MKQLSLILISMMVFVCAHGYATTTEQTDSDTIYVITLNSKTEIYAQQFSVNEKYDSLTFKSLHTGMTSTLPLNRIITIEMLSLPKSSEVVAENITRNTLFTNDIQTTSAIDDGGIPCNFYVVSVSSGGSSGKSTGNLGGASTSTSRNTNKSSTGLNSGSSWGSGNSSSNTRSSSGYSSNTSGYSSSRSNSSSSRSGADAFMDIFFR